MAPDPFDGFRSMGDGRPVDVLALVRAALLEHHAPEVMVGCDSLNRGTWTQYATTVVLRYPGNGARVFFRRDRTDRQNTLWERLWGEVERSIAVATWLREHGGVPVRRIDMDLNSDERYASNRLHAAAVGYVRAHGYEPCTKPALMIASWAANILCNGNGHMHEAPIHRVADRGDVTLQIDL